MKTRVLNAGVEFFDQQFRKPLQLSTGLITQITEARAHVTVCINGKEAVGRGSIYLSDLWAWPDPALSHPQRDQALRGLCENYARELPSLCGGEPEHPLELGLRLHHNVAGYHEEKTRQPFPSNRDGPDPDIQKSNIPILAKAMCASPFDAAIHDGVGIALGKSAFDFYSEEAPIPSADPCFPGKKACAAIQQTIRREPCSELDAWWLISAKDDLGKDVLPWVRERGYRCFKLKILAKDNSADAARTAEVFRVVKSWGIACPRLTVDSNEGNPDAASVLDYLERLRAMEPAAFAALEYLEQPTGRDITKYAYDWRPVTRLKPVLLDEGLTSPYLFNEAKAQGWSGFALKTCKGHSFALLAAAWARENGMVTSLQDLTNPGFSGIHAALFAAYIPMINGIELNSPQYTPSANAEWLPRLNRLFEPRDGVHQLRETDAAGLGSLL